MDRARFKDAAIRWFTANSYAGAVHELWADVGGDRPGEQRVTLPSALLGGFACELYLKSWLLADDAPINDVWGHDLGKLNRSCKDRGLQEIEGLESLLSSLVDGHRQFDYRYVTPGKTFHSPNWKLALPILLRLDNAVEQKLVTVSEDLMAPWQRCLKEDLPIE